MACGQTLLNCHFSVNLPTAIWGKVGTGLEGRVSLVVEWPVHLLIN